MQHDISNWLGQQINLEAVYICAQVFKQNMIEHKLIQRTRLWGHVIFLKARAISRF
jgi:hypothetical protein